MSVSLPSVPSRHGKRAVGAAVLIVGSLLLAGYGLQATTASSAESARVVPPPLQPTNRPARHRAKSRCLPADASGACRACSSMSRA